MAMDPAPSQPTSSDPGTIRIPEPGAATPFAPGQAPSEPPVVVDSPISPASPDAFARFEFEAGRGKEGTKILMVEWDPASVSVADEDGWEVTWDSKKTTFPVWERITAEENDNNDNDEGKQQKQQERERRQRVYFLLPSSATVPAAVTITHAASGRFLTAISMPAIFAPGLGVGSREAGRRGVLHTVWARLRAEQLQEEIRAELRDNSESVGLEMAVQERLWVIDHFGLDDLRPLPDAGPGGGAAVGGVDGHASQAQPQSPRSPIGGRLGEKLRGLKLATSPSDLANPLGTPYSQQHNPHLPRPDPPPQAVRRAEGATVSLDAVLGGGGNRQPAAAAPATQSKETEDELFALPMSPRSPDMKAKSPFSLLK